ncbi:thermonuclease family protein [Bacillus sp. ISL-45]|uniref:thermonuclease family protein n=1 Tax=Bacillus sp. ISL-45 TaxID=2819128 RepID=UPI001BE7AF2C|nr:thermonuclease family protein [Bacillus sp. ISL-45]
MNYIKNFSVILAILMAFFILPILASAHNGSRDELGGHFRNADCVYILHEPTSIAKSADNIGELIRLIHQYNSNSDCAAGLNEEKVDLEGNTFSGAGNDASESNQAAGEMPKAEVSTGKLQLGKMYEAELSDCIDGDTAVFTMNGKDYKTRFLYIDTPESTRTKEPFGPEAAQYTCSFLKQGKIKLETDGGSLFDKYDRLLAWVWAGDKLHQEEITKAGLVEDFYDYGSYKYENRIWSAMDYAEDSGKGIYAATDGPEEGNEQSQEQPKNQDDHTSQEQQPKNDSEENQQDSQPEDRKEDTKVTDQQRESKQESDQADTADEEFDYSFLIGLLYALLFYLTVPIKKAMGKRTLIAHRLWSKKWPLNLLLGVIYAYLCYITLLLLLVEILHFFKNKRRKRK